MAKRGGVDDVNHIMLLCLLENNQVDESGVEIEPDNMDGVAALLNTLAPHGYWSNERDRMDRDMQYLRRMPASYRSWFADGDEAFEWRTPLPPAAIDTLLGQYHATYQAGEINQMAARLCQHAAEWADFPVKNMDGVPSLFFPGDTPTEKLAELVCGAHTRMRLECGRKHGVQDTDPGLALFRFWVGVIRSQGYLRADGTMGVRDLATNLQAVFGGPHHPLTPSMAAHSRHGEAFHISGNNPNLSFELWWINRFRGWYRTSGLVGLLDMMRPVLQSLRDTLVDRGVIHTRRTLGRPSSRLAQMWSRNQVSLEERLVVDQDYLPGLEQGWQQYLKSLPPKTNLSADRCLHCDGQRVRRRNACRSCNRLTADLVRARRVQAEMQAAGGGAPDSPLSLQLGVDLQPRVNPPHPVHGVGAGLGGASAPTNPVPIRRTCALCGVSPQTANKNFWHSIPGPQYVCATCSKRAETFKKQSKSYMPINSRQQKHSPWGCQCAYGCSRGRRPDATEADKPKNGRSVCGPCFSEWYSAQLASRQAREDMRVLAAAAAAQKQARQEKVTLKDTEKQGRKATRRAPQAQKKAQDAVDAAAKRSARAEQKAQREAEKQRKEAEKQRKEVEKQRKEAARKAEKAARKAEKERTEAADEAARVQYARDAADYALSELPLNRLPVRG